MYDAEHFTKRVSPVSRNYTNQNRLLSVRGLKFGRRGVLERWWEEGGGLCFAQAINNGARPLRILATFSSNLQNVFGRSRQPIKMPHVEFLFKQATNTTIDSAKYLTAACTDGSGCGLRTTSEDDDPIPSEVPFRRGHPSVLTTN